MQSVTTKKITSKPAIVCRSQRDLRKQALAQGVPEFMLRLAAAQQVCFLPTNSMPRHRHD